MIGDILWPLTGLCATIGLILAAFYAVSWWQDRDPATRLVHRHALPRRDRGEHDFWGAVETGTEGALGNDCSSCGGRLQEDEYPYCDQCLSEIQDDYFSDEPAVRHD